MTVPQSLGSSTRWLTAGTLAALAGNLVTTPVLLSELGSHDFGQWALVSGIATTLALVDLGLASAVTRFVSVHRGQGDLSTARAAWRAGSQGFIAFACAVAVTGALAAYCFPELLASASGQDRPTAVAAATGLLVVTIMTLPLRACLLGLELFRSSAVLQCASSAALAGSLSIAASQNSLTLTIALGCATAAVALQACGQYFSVLSALRGIPRAERTRAQRRELFRFAGWMQLNGLSELINNQCDRFVIGAVAGVANVGAYEVGNTIARAARVVPGQYLTALGPRMATETASAPQGRLSAVYLRAITVLSILSFCMLGLVIVAARAALEAWLGTVPPQAYATAVLLALGFAVNNLTGPASAWVRAVGKPSLETRYGLVQSLLNAGLSILLGWRFGLLGVVAATSISAVAASVYFLVLVHRRENPARLVTVLGLVGRVLACAVVAIPIATLWRECFTSTSRPQSAALALAQAVTFTASFFVLVKLTRAKEASQAPAEGVND